MTVFGMVFERHGREFPVVNGTSLLGRAVAGNPADPCNNVAAALLRPIPATRIMRPPLRMQRRPMPAAPRAQTRATTG
jgi:hypothetical protein